LCICLPVGLNRSNKISPLRPDLHCHLAQAGILRECRLTPSVQANSPAETLSCLISNINTKNVSDVAARIREKMNRNQ
jgi:hypothetical protein